MFNSATTGLQTVAYKYDKINRLTYGTSSTGWSETEIGMEMLYNKADANLGSTASFNGKLSAVKWMSKDAGGVSCYERSFKYSYDAINCYTAAVYAKRTTAGTGAFDDNIGGFNESVSYDVGGNITALTRNSSTQGTNSNTQWTTLHIRPTPITQTGCSP